jgi:hypothetical protein
MVGSHCAPHEAAAVASDGMTENGSTSSIDPTACPKPSPTSTSDPAMDVIADTQDSSRDHQFDNEDDQQVVNMDHSSPLHATEVEMNAEPSPDFILPTPLRGVDHLEMMEEDLDDCVSLGSEDDINHMLLGEMSQVVELPDAHDAITRGLSDMDVGEVC